MNPLRNPRTKLILAVALLVAVLGVGTTQGLSGAATARLLLALVALGGLGWWLYRQRTVQAGAAPRRRMQVLDRTGLSARCGLALVAIDGREFLVAYGDGFAEVQPASAAPPPVSKARRPFPAPRAGKARRPGGAR